ncbi:MAG TPA: DUF4294 domain-containing protein [Cryomorphaceae bacterium]|nr:DUF4294 domain-containing protein [Cryomorphaceae bacterium]
MLKAHVGRRIDLSIYFFIFLLSTPIYAQVDTLSEVKDGTLPIVGQIVVGGDTIPWSVLDEVLFVPKPTLNDYQARRNYYTLKRKVRRVYPYVREAAIRIDSVNRALERIDHKRQRRKYTKQYQRFLEERFKSELRKLTRSEGQILSKLIYRETGRPVYDIIKTYRNGLSARFWSITAWWYDIDLKRPYDPVNNAEDGLIENILIRNFISGQLTPASDEERNKYQP